MAKPWADVANSPQYQALPPDQQEAARNQYFSQVVAPQVSPDQIPIAKSQFDASTAVNPIYQRNSTYALPAPADGYQTKLSPEDEAKFQQWVKDKNVPFDPSPKADYDMRGFYQGMQNNDPNARTGTNASDGKLHFSDYWKTPYHQSFSAESKFADPNKAPHWNDKDQLVTPDGKVVFDERAKATGSSAKSMSDSVQKMLDNPMDASNTLDKSIGGAKEMSLAEKVIRLPETAANAMWENIGGVKRGAGLATRATAEGFTGGVNALTDLAAYGVNKLGSGYHKLTGQDDWQYVPDSAQQTFRNGLTELGLPLPESKAEELGSAVGRGAASAASGIATGQLMQGASNPIVAGTGDILVSSPGAQTVAGGSSGASGELARQAGASPEVQQIAGLVGGVAGGLKARNIDASAPEASLPAGSATTASGAEKLREFTAQAEAKAQQGAEKIGLHWDDLEQNLKDQLMKNAEQATIVGSDLPPEALARKAIYESLGIKPTKALITRNFSDALNEQNLLTEDQGAALRDIYAENNQAIRTRLQGLKPEGADAVDQPTFGEQFRAPVAQGERASQAASNEAYTAAQAAEGANQVDISKLNNFLKANAGILDNRPATTGLTNDFREMGLMRNEAASPELAPASPSFTLQKLASVRAATNEAWTTAKNTGDARAAGRLNELRGILDEMENEAGGELYKAYRKIRSEKGAAYENNPLIDKLLSDQKGYYGTAAIEDSQVFDKVVLGSSTEQFGKVWSQLTTKAQDLTRAQLAKYIENRTFSNMGMNERGDVVASAAKLNQTLDSINPQKLHLIFGKEKAVELERLNTAVREISSPPRGTVPQGSAPKLVYRMNLLMKGLGLVTRIPFAGDIAKAIGAAAEKGAAAKANEAASEAAINPLPPVAPSPKSFGEKLEGFAEPATSLTTPAALTQPGIIAPLLQDRNQQ